MKRVSDLAGPELDYWVAMAAGMENVRHHTVGPTTNGGAVFVEHVSTDGHLRFQPTENWGHAGPIIEREKIEVKPAANTYKWGARIDSHRRLFAPRYGYGDTPLIAAMRAFVASKYGDHVDAESQQNAGADSAPEKSLIGRITAFVRCDASAASYQSLGQYRTALLRMLREAQANTEGA